MRRAGIIHPSKNVAHSNWHCNRMQCGVLAGILFTLHLTQYTKCNDGVNKCFLYTGKNRWKILHCVFFGIFFKKKKMLKKNDS
jgi:hypothetical protein